MYSSNKDVELIDVTADVERVVAESGIESGICVVSVPHATAAVIENEAEEGLMEDIVERILEFFPKGIGYRHDVIDDNAHAHLAAAFLGSSRTFPVNDGRLTRGTWQNIFLVELDGPRSARKVVVTVIGDRHCEH
ncbi:MAG: secondary thiamine-phosphate synthase enzyme YjbQ [Nitrososphaeria archaeon]